MKQDKVIKQNMDKILTSIYANDKDRLMEMLSCGINIEIEDSDGRTPLIYAVMENKEEMVTMLIDKGVNVNKQDINGYSPLHFASQRYLVSIANILIQFGALVDILDNNGNTPLSDAVFYSEGRDEMITLLLSKGANKDLKNNYGISAFDLAKSISNYDVTQFFNSK
ncbi:MAG: hypothetical protein K0S41_1845 [Anaerocolumna sp.]|nr:hypothetical protein [Anaerocolumna sp.]